MLPLGSIVIINKKSILVAGYGPSGLKADKQFDYIGIFAKYGLTKADNLELGKDYICFNNEDITSILFLGLNDDEHRKYVKAYNYAHEHQKEITDTLCKEIEKSKEDGSNEK